MTAVDVTASSALLPGVARDFTLKILGVTLSSQLSASDHIRRVISNSAQSLYALRVLRYHGLSDVGMQTVFRAVVVTRLMYASPAWRGFVTATDLKRVDAFLRRCKRCAYTALLICLPLRSCWTSPTTGCSARL